MQILESRQEDWTHALRIEFAQSHHGRIAHLPGRIFGRGCQQRILGSRVVLVSREQAVNALVAHPPVRVAHAAAQFRRCVQRLRLRSGGRPGGSFLFEPRIVLVDDGDRSHWADVDDIWLIFGWKLQETMMTQPPGLRHGRDRCANQQIVQGPVLDLRGGSPRSYRRAVNPVAMAKLDVAPALAYLVEPGLPERLHGLPSRDDREPGAHADGSTEAMIGGSIRSGGEASSK